MAYSLPETKPAKSKAAKIPRPMNAFMIFAREHRPRVKKEHPTEENHVISIRLGNIWAGLSREEKDHYQELSKEAVNEHRRKYPDYRYEPKPKIKKKRRYDHYLLMDKLRTAAAQAAKEQKEERDAAKHGVTPKSAPPITTTVTSVSYSAAQQPLVSTSAPTPQIQSYLPEGKTQYPKGYYYSPYPNIIPAHSQPTRPSNVMGSYGSNPYIMPYLTNHPTADSQYLSQPLDMSKNTSRTQTTTTDKTGKVYCELTTPAKNGPTLAAQCPNQTWTARQAMGYGAPWVNQRRMTNGLINTRPSAPEFQQQGIYNKAFMNQISSMPLSSKTEGDHRTELVWIPCEPDFAKKMGWSLDPSFQGRSTSALGKQ